MFMCHASVCCSIMAQLIVYLVFITHSKGRCIGPNGMGITKVCVCVCVTERQREREREENKIWCI